MKAFAQEEARDFDDEYWLLLIHEGSNKKRIECCKDNNGFLCYLRVSQGHVYYIFHRGISWNFQSILGSGIILGGKENDKDRQAVFFTHPNPFGDDP